MFILEAISSIKITHGVVVYRYFVPTGRFISERKKPQKIVGGSYFHFISNPFETIIKLLRRGKTRPLSGQEGIGGKTSRFFCRWLIYSRVMFRLLYRQEIESQRKAFSDMSPHVCRAVRYFYCYHFSNVHLPRKQSLRGLFHDLLTQNTIFVGSSIKTSKQIGITEFRNLSGF